MKATKPSPILFLSLIVFAVGCVQNETGKNKNSSSTYGSASTDQQLTPTSDRPGEPHIYSNSTSRATSPAGSTENQ